MKLAMQWEIVSWWNVRMQGVQECNPRLPYYQEARIMAGTDAGPFVLKQPSIQQPPDDGEGPKKDKLRQDLASFNLASLTQLAHEA